VACENIQIPDGALVLVSGTGETEWFQKSYAPYRTNWTDNEYYLGLSGGEVANATSDVLGAKLLCDGCEPTWAAVANAVPPIRVSGSGGHWGTNW
jgi:hypothetical protein